MKGERFLIDTCIFTHMAVEPYRLSKDVEEILYDYNNIICMSVESQRELIVSFNNGELVSKYWNTAKEMIDSISEKFFIKVLPLQEDCMKIYSTLKLNTAQRHKDSSDHVIIAQAITMGIPLISSDGKFAFYTKQGLHFIHNKT